MSEVTIRPATMKDAEDISTMLSQLAGELGSTNHFFSTPKAIKRYGFGTKPCFHCIITERKTIALGLALFFPIFSTNRAKPGAYVQDLWISSAARGLGLGRRMLVEVANYSTSEWNAAYLSLTVHASNISAVEFYQKLGFNIDKNEMPMVLDGEAFAQIRSAR